MRKKKEKTESGGPLASPLCDHSPAPRAELQASRSEAFKTTSLLVVWSAVALIDSPDAVLIYLKGGTIAATTQGREATAATVA